MNPNDALEFAMLAGEIMLSSGAETYRVEDTIVRILTNCKLSSPESFVSTTGLFASIKDKNEGFLTAFKRVSKRSNHFEKIALVNTVSRDFQAGKLTLYEAIAELKEINSIKQRSIFSRIIFAGIAVFSFTYIFGGQFLDCISALITGCIFQALIAQMERSKVNTVLTTMFGGGIIALLTLSLVNLGVGTNVDIIIIGSIMLLVPGLQITNAVRDILTGDFLSGSARVMDAIITAVAIATGVGTVMEIWISLFGGVAL